MKKLLYVIITSTIAFSCKDAGTETTAKTESTPDVANENVQYAYTVDHPQNWQWGDVANTQTSMKALKAFEMGNVDEAMQYFTDTVTVEFDGFEAKASRDSIGAILKKARDNYKSLQIKMEDYESVKSKDGKTEYVSLWYKQYWEDHAGKKDSIECFNDLKMQNGKIAVLSEMTRHFATKKM